MWFITADRRLQLRLQKACLHVVKENGDNQMDILRSSCVRCWGNTSVFNMTLIRLKSTNLISFDVNQYDYTV